MVRLLRKLTVITIAALGLGLFGSDDAYAIRLASATTYRVEADSNTPATQCLGVDNPYTYCTGAGTADGTQDTVLDGGDIAAELEACDTDNPAGGCIILLPCGTYREAEFDIGGDENGARGRHVGSANTDGFPNGLIIQGQGECTILESTYDNPTYPGPWDATTGAGNASLILVDNPGETDTSYFPYIAIRDVVLEGRSHYQPAPSHATDGWGCASPPCDCGTAPCVFSPAISEHSAIRFRSLTEAYGRVVIQNVTVRNFISGGIRLASGESTAIINAYLHHLQCRQPLNNSLCVDVDDPSDCCSGPSSGTCSTQWFGGAITPDSAWLCGDLSGQAQNYGWNLDPDYSNSHWGAKQGSAIAIDGGGSPGGIFSVRADHFHRYVPQWAGEDLDGGGLDADACAAAHGGKRGVGFDHGCGGFVGLVRDVTVSDWASSAIYSNLGPGLDIRRVNISSSLANTPGVISTTGWAIGVGTPFNRFYVEDATISSSQGACVILPVQSIQGNETPAQLVNVSCANACQNAAPGGNGGAASSYNGGFVFSTGNLSGVLDSYTSKATTVELTNVDFTAGGDEKCASALRVADPFISNQQPVTIRFMDANSSFAGGTDPALLNYGENFILGTSGVLDADGVVTFSGSSGDNVQFWPSSSGSCSSWSCTGGVVVNDNSGNSIGTCGC